jgi:hypothetical protein
MKTKPLRYQTPIGKNADLPSGIANRYCEDNVGGSRSPMLRLRNHKQST